MNTGMGWQELRPTVGTGDPTAVHTSVMVNKKKKKKADPKLDKTGLKDNQTWYLTYADYHT